MEMRSNLTSLVQFGIGITTVATKAGLVNKGKMVAEPGKNCPEQFFMNPAF